jgi:hypothetical protein
MAISIPATDITASPVGTNTETVMRESKDETVEGRTDDPSRRVAVRVWRLHRRDTRAGRRFTIALALLPMVLACGRKSDQDPSRSPGPVAMHDSAHSAAPAVPADSFAKGARHAHLKGAQTEAICTTLADVQQFYTPGQDPTQESLSCSMIFGGQSTADVAVLGTQGPYVHVRLYDKSGHSSDGYMREQALR